MARRLATCSGIGVAAAGLYGLADALGLIKVPVAGGAVDMALAGIGAAVASYLALYGPLSHTNDAADEAP